MSTSKDDSKEKSTYTREQRKTSKGGGYGASVTLYTVFGVATAVLVFLTLFFIFFPRATFHAVCAIDSTAKTVTKAVSSAVIPIPKKKPLLSFLKIDVWTLVMNISVSITALFTTLLLIFGALFLRRFFATAESTENLVKSIETVGRETAYSVISDADLTIREVENVAYQDISCFVDVTTALIGDSIPWKAFLAAKAVAEKAEKIADAFKG